LSINLAWGMAVVLGVYVAGGVSGAHINPAVTLAMAVRRGFPWRKVAPYCAAQFAGAFVASAVVYAVHCEAIDAYEIAESPSASATSPAPRTMKTAGIWATYPRDFSASFPDSLPNETRLSTFPGGLVDQIVGTALLVLCVFALTDSRNLAPQSNLGPLLVGGVVLTIGMTFGSNCGYAINPARDLAPRLFTFCAGWGSQVFRSPDSYWWLVPIIGPCVGGVIGAVVYDLLITKRHPDQADSEGGEESE
jgi:MIP family channel proteins